MGDFIFDDFQKFSFYKSDKTDYCIPEGKTREALAEFVETLPLSNTPHVFGLHGNAEIGYERINPPLSLLEGVAMRVARCACRALLHCTLRCR